jgi:hypothetical protein
MIQYAWLEMAVTTDDLLFIISIICEPSDGVTGEQARVETILTSLLARMPELAHQREEEEEAIPLIELARDYPGQTRLMEMMANGGAGCHARDMCAFSLSHRFCL